MIPGKATWLRHEGCEQQKLFLLCRSAIIWFDKERLKTSYIFFDKCAQTMY
ncbi:hypothetical protein ACE1CA_05365 [Aerosakkonemataceae cyanobacterium BLCC-F167]|uniref:Uncharacterized protein n=1 Tax=Floridaenema evergladense BLCC-F167 TaxID=3153639 RepID=A0ABV4WGZ4_9CYAN